MKTHITGDLYNISGRLKEIDSGYYAVYDYKLRRYEVHHIGQKGNTLCIVLPYDRLDARAIEHVRRTRAERREQIISDMERRNRELQRAEMKEVMRSAQNMVESYC